ncbi:hypothetical protein ACIRF8_15505 [Streptomyces sp. NPDC102406]|uniref:hypothetical protein n=1 Tax=Streptomyces sp. NPDC102406 TaxID=3366171 RepID=UPI003809D05B
MAAREYVGTGGMRVHLDDPVGPEMAKQIARGDLVPVSGSAPDVEDGNKSLVVVHGSEADTVNHVGDHIRVPGEHPGDDSSAMEWATYAVALGLNSTQACTLSVGQLREWVAEHEKTLGEGEPAPVTPADETGPEPVEKPAAGAKVADWRAYAISLGMDPDEAKDATKQACQDYAAVVEDAQQPEDFDAEGQE